MGRGRAIPIALGVGPTAAKPSAPAPGAFFQHPTGITLSAEQTAAATAATTAVSAAAAQQSAVNPGQKLLAQLHGQGTTSHTGAKIGQHLLSQLQVQSNSRSGSETGPDAGQELLLQLQGQAAVSAPGGAELGQGLLQQLQSGASALLPLSLQQATGNASLAQTDAGRALLAQLQRPLAQSQQALNSMAQPIAQPVPPPYQGSGGIAASGSFEQLLRGAAATQRPVAQPMAQPAVQWQHPSIAAPSFTQLLSSAMAQQQPPPPPPRFSRPPQPLSTTPSQAGPPGFAVTHQQPTQPPQPLAASMTDPGRLLLQQLHGGGLGRQGGALGQQPQGVPNMLSHQQRGGALQGGALGQPPQGLPTAMTKAPARPAGSNEAGQMLLQQLQRASLSDAAASVVVAVRPGPSDSVGAVVDAPQPVPSAPNSVLLQSAADTSGTTTKSGTNVIQP